MNLRHAVRPAMYGSFAGVAAGFLLMITNRTSPDVAICICQFLAIVSCGAGDWACIGLRAAASSGEAQTFWAQTRGWAGRKKASRPALE